MKLIRSDDDKWIAGVAGGLSEALGIDSTIIRIIFAVVSVFYGGGILIYLVLWAVMPRPTGGTMAEDGINKAKEWNADRKSRNPGSSPEAGSGSDFTI